MYVRKRLVPLNCCLAFDELDEGYFEVELQEPCLNTKYFRVGFAVEQPQNSNALVGNFPESLGIEIFSRKIFFTPKRSTLFSVCTIESSVDIPTNIKAGDVIVSVFYREIFVIFVLRVLDWIIVKTSTLHSTERGYVQTTSREFLSRKPLASYQWRIVRTNMKIL